MSKWNKEVRERARGNIKKKEAPKVNGKKSTGEKKKKDCE